MPGTPHAGSATVISNNVAKSVHHVCNADALIHLKFDSQHNYQNNSRLAGFDVHWQHLFKKFLVVDMYC